MTRALAPALALALALALAPALALAQGETIALSNGWSLTSRLRRLTDVNAVACSADRAYARGWGGGVAEWDGSAWHELPEIPGYGEGRTYGTHLEATPTGVLVEASGRVASWDGSAWSIATRASAGRYDPFGGLASVGADVYAVGRGWIARRDGTDLRTYDAGTWRDLSAVAGTGPGDLWTAGQGGTLMHWDGRAWARSASGTDVTLGGLFAVSASEVWAWSARGATPIVLRWNGREWIAIPPPLGDELRQVSAQGGRVWAATSVGVFERADGTWQSALTSYDFGEGDQREIVGACATRTHLVAGAGLGSVLTRPL